MLTTDVFIAGGGPAGLATAIATRQLGLDAIVADLVKPPVDKACGEGLMPDGVAALRRLGIEPDATEAHPFRGIRFITDDATAAANFPRAQGLGIRRTVLHQMLMRRAEEAGVVMRWGTRVDGLDERGDVRLGGDTVLCKWIIGADGHNSRIRRATMAQPHVSTDRVGVRQHFCARSWTDLVEVYWHPRGQAYVTPIADGEICIAIIGTDSGVRIGDLGRFFPLLAARLKDAAPASASRAGRSASSTLRSVARGRVALVGDASGSVDAVTGDGLSLAFCQALALADALADQNLARYQTAHRRIMRMPRIMSRLLTLIGEHDGLRHRAIHALAARPTAFARLLAVHAGAASPSSIGLGTIAGLGWELLANRRVAAATSVRSI